MEIPPQLQCLFSAEIEEDGESFVVDVPENEVQTGDLEAGKTYRVALFATESSPQQRSAGSQSTRAQGPPVEEGETRRVEIEDIGEQGDGVARVERGYVVIVPDAELGERVAIEVHDVQSNVAFAEVTERLPLNE
ncbi:TRAM domain-containing protein [Haloarcula nitratireducens]|uniref:TRAM domain-containing protein n=1 Tax=Haloarcula nitratireducens TaxID=2487749 RepID=A0AAW4PG12_9EURY|nr:TRAM domain-containing protein [Halomicroarcula nitratireducens]MBX0296813.1 TRAM domain-containing protein [Halomicroarcula nitratireducens]